MTLTSAIQEVAADQRESDPEITTRDAVEHVRATIGVDQVQDDADNAAAYRMVLAATDAEISAALDNPEMLTFDTVIAVARRDAGLTAAEFDYQLNLGSELGARAYQGLGNAIYRLANEGPPEAAEGRHDDWRDRVRRADALHKHFADAIERMVAEAKTKRYTGWSTASSGPIRYA